MKKTWGRELAVLSLVFWLSLTWHFFFNMDETPELVMAYSSAYTIATISIWAFVTTIFTTDKVVKNK